MICQGARSRCGVMSDVTTPRIPLPHLSLPPRYLTSQSTASSDPCPSAILHHRDLDFHSIFTDEPWSKRTGDNRGANPNPTRTSPFAFFSCIQSILLSSITVSGRYKPSTAQQYIILCRSQFSLAVGGMWKPLQLLCRAEAQRGQASFETGPSVASPRGSPRRPKESSSAENSYLVHSEQPRAFILWGSSEAWAILTGASSGTALKLRRWWLVLSERVTSAL